MKTQPKTQTVERPRGRILQRLRGRIMQGQPLCRMCDEKGLVTPGAEMDHIVPLFMGGTNDDENLQMLCVECHRKKSADDLGVRFKPTIGSDGWPISPEPGGAGQNPRAKTP
jgi:5-methylcytosine-specific restriction protein A